MLTNQSPAHFDVGAVFFGLFCFSGLLRSLPQRFFCSGERRRCLLQFVAERRHLLRHTHTGHCEQQHSQSLGLLAGERDNLGASIKVVQQMIQSFLSHCHSAERFGQLRNLFLAGYLRNKSRFKHLQLVFGGVGSLPGLPTHSPIYSQVE